jgi:DNA-binding MarR family transcriptional regulator
VADVFHLAGAFRRRGESIAARAGRTQAEWQVLSAASDGGRSVPRIARRLGFARQSVQRTADDLVRQELARYVPNPDHKRSPLLELTDRGGRVLEQISKEARSFHAHLGRHFDPVELDRVRLLLRRMCEVLDVTSR